MAHTASGASTVSVRSRPRAALPALCVTQVASWGILYYAFPVMLPTLTADTGWSTTAVTAAFSLALVVSATAGIAVGRLLDRNGPRVVMTVGAALGAAALLVVAAAPSLPLFTLGWLAAGLAMSATFYQPAFAALTRWYADDRVRALTVLTLAGGLASTVFAPLTAGLVEHLGWRHAVTALAGVLLVVVVPLHWFALSGPWPAATTAEPHLDVHAARPVLRSRAFLTLMAALTLSGFAMYAVVFGLVPLMTERGATATTAAWALGLGGLGQTLGRTLYHRLAARTTVTTRTTLLILSGGVTTSALAFVPGPSALLVAGAVAAGMVRGNLTLLQATAVVDRWGPGEYGRLSGVLAAPVTIAGALAPWAGAALAPTLGGYPHLFAVLAGLSIAAAGLSVVGRAFAR